MGLGFGVSEFLAGTSKHSILLWLWGLGTKGGSEGRGATGSPSAAESGKDATDVPGMQTHKSLLAVTEDETETLKQALLSHLTPRTKDK